MLKPCPFCGEGANLGVTEEFRDDCFVVRCYTCGACGGTSNSKFKAIENWNHRPLEAEMAAALEGLVEHGTTGTRVAAKDALAKVRGLEART